ncbi:MAG: hypothetical protein R3307_10865 [Anaerolineales bacterium]|nr:hypothetical protein [Anaerolineales bacterium]
MKNRTLPYLLIFIVVISACGRGEIPASPFPPPASTSTDIPAAETFTPIPTLTPTSTPAPTETPTQTPIPTVDSLKAKVIADKLSCRYGPGPLYLYLYALNGTANITLIGRTDANDWVWVDGTNKCWVHSKFLETDGDPQHLPIVYPGLKLPVSPYYPGPSWANATRDGDSVEITWEPVPISAGKYENANMQQYLVEVWRCEAGEIIFETLGTNYPAIVVENDEPGCDFPSHGRVFVQEKHGYGGPVEVPWPPHAEQ